MHLLKSISNFQKFQVNSFQKIFKLGFRVQYLDVLGIGVVANAERPWYGFGEGAAIIEILKSRFVFKTLYTLC